MRRRDAGVVLPGGRVAPTGLVARRCNRAENRLARLAPLHRDKAFGHRDETERERAKRDHLRDALRDCDDAVDLVDRAPPDDPDDPDDGRPWVKRARVKLALGDVDAARSDLKEALRRDGRESTKKTAARVRRDVLDQVAKEKAFYGQIALNGGL